ncbi:hypothetical protein D9758_000074 [Tetrapyrgos nigripes]|uniref:Uncharacterized protein n=1 Tax=Tetrapyrgos nigripes TaxID=182062 RepID=A0A8H5H0V7_9AGAR|nr:hypothetical protein D9758_000074 [Tetrapyrgos nigripes]
MVSGCLRCSRSRSFQTSFLIYSLSLAVYSELSSRRMPISFIPPLGDTTRVHIPPWYTTCSHASTVQLQFTAFLDDDEFQQFNDGMKVQIWSNIPSQERYDGQWGAMDFETKQSDQADFHAVSLSLGHSSEEDYNVQTKNKHILFLHLSVPFSNAASISSFTYRLLLPTGEQRWLGLYGQNGILILDKTDPDASGLSLEKEGWESTNSDSVPVWQWRASTDSEGKDLFVAKITRPQDWSIQGIGKEGYLDYPYVAKTTSLLFLAPRVHPYSILRPRTFVLRTPPDNALSISSRNASKQVLNIHAPCSGPVFLEAYETVDSLLEKLDLTHFGTLRHLQSSSNRHLVMMWSPSDVFPRISVVIPLFSENPEFTGQPTLLHMKTANLAAPLGSNITRFTLFSAGDLGVHFVDLQKDKEPQSTGTGTSDHVSLSVSSAGGQFILSPLYSIPRDSDPGEVKSSSSLGSLHVSILSSHSAHVVDSSADDYLPTPPPSPHLRPPSALREQNVTASSNTSTSDMGMPSRQDAFPIGQAMVEDKSEDLDANRKMAEMEKGRLSEGSGEINPGDGQLRDIDEVLEEEDAYERRVERAYHSPTGQISHSDVNSSLAVRFGPGTRRFTRSFVSSFIDSITSRRYVTSRKNEGRFPVLTALLKGAFRAFTLWLSMLVHSLLRSGHSKSMRAPQTDPEMHVQSPVTDADVTRDEEDDALEVEVNSPVVDERTPLLSRLSHASENQGCVPTGSQPSSKTDQPVQVNAGTSDLEPLVKNQAASQKTKNFLVFDLLDSVVGHGEVIQHSMLIRWDDKWDFENVSTGRTLLEQLDIQLNGKPILLTDVKALKSGVALVSLAKRNRES